ncbi:hypothetical protein [Luteolibacter soli]|uniref:Uncharacterized protein n=1 Tax=Luteolibacter soli TaxID=3135280 RepID=A0ABU9B1N2_9BACT
MIALAWTTFFSMFNRQPIRGNRNFGLLACYIIFIVMLFRRPFAETFATWAVFGFAGGLCYLGYEVISRLRTSPGEEKPGVSLVTLFYGLLAWPVMIPEAIEYLAADFGLLPVPVVPTAVAGDATESAVTGEEEA